KKKYSEQKIASLLDEARTKAAEQAEAAKKKIISTTEREVKRRSMRLRDALIQEIMSRVEKKLASMTGDKNYRSVLAGWLTEAAVGLAAQSACVNASPEELKLIDDKMLAEVGRLVRKKTGGKVELKLSEARKRAARSN
ncbi:MAG: V-type ATP synthase subunit E family protein, partial [Planctomycetota bacterium]